MTTERATMLLEAEDRASSKVEALGARLKRVFGTDLLASIKSLVSFSAILGAAGVSVTLLFTKVRDMWNEIRQANRAIAIMNTQLTLSGFTAERTTRILDGMRNSMSRTVIAALPQLDRGLRALLQTLGSDGQRRFGETVENLQKLGFSVNEATDAVARALAGDFGQLDDLFGLDEGSIESWEELDRIIQKQLDQRTPLEKLWDGIVDRWNSKWQEIVDNFNRILSGNLVDAIEGIVNLIPFILGILPGLIVSNLGTTIREALEGFIESIPEIVESGKLWAIRMVIGLVEWLLGEDAANLVRFALLGHWALVWATLKNDVLGWGEGIGTAIRDGLIKLVLGDTFGQAVINALDSEGGLMGALKSLWPSGRSWGESLGIAIGNGLIAALEGAINYALGRLNEWLRDTVAKINVLPGVNIRAPQIGRVNLPRFGGEVLSGQGPGFGQRNTGPTDRREVVFQVGDRQFGRMVMEVVDGRIRVLNPRTDIT